MISAPEKVGKAILMVRDFVPEFEVIRKTDSKLHKAIGWLLSKLGNKVYMERFWTTLGYQAASPTYMDVSTPHRAWEVVLHEGFHAYECKKQTRGLFSLAYLFPQVIGILGLLTAPWWPSWWFALSLLALAPLPAPFRAWAEIKAYKVSIAALWWSGVDVGKTRTIESIVDSFVNGNYYYMWPFRGMLEAHLYAYVADLRAGYGVLTPYHAAVKKLAEEFKE